MRYEIEREIQKAVRAASEDGWAAGATQLEIARGRWPDDPRILAQLGYYNYRLEKLTDARGLLETAVELGHESADTFFHLGLVCYYQKQYNEALEWAQQSLELRPQHDLAELLAGQAIWEKIQSERFILDERKRMDLVHAGHQHIERSVRASDLSWRDATHNQRARDLLERFESELASVELGH